MAEVVTYDKQYGEKLNNLLSRYFELVIEFEHLNSIIKNAYEHGSDGHGGFNANEEGLINAMTKYIRWRGISEIVSVASTRSDGLIYAFMPESELRKRAKQYGGDD